jgi:hypothetical protein
MSFGDEPRSARVQGGKQQGERILVGMSGQLVQHPFEMAYGSGWRLRVPLSEVLHLLDVHRLYGRDLGWIDMHLLATALLSRCALWTQDVSLRGAALALNLSG